VKMPIAFDPRHARHDRARQPSVALQHLGAGLATIRLEVAHQAGNGSADHGADDIVRGGHVGDPIRNASLVASFKVLVPDVRDDLGP